MSDRDDILEEIKWHFTQLNLDRSNLTKEDLGKLSEALLEVDDPGLAKVVGMFSEPREFLDYLGDEE